MSETKKWILQFMGEKKTRLINDILWVAHDLMVLELKQRLKEEDDRRRKGKLDFYGDQRIPKPQSQRRVVIEALLEVQLQIDERRPSPVTNNPKGIVKDLAKRCFPMNHQN